jgi:hypothetical protein
LQRSRRQRPPLPPATARRLPRRQSANGTRTVVR